MIVESQAGGPFVTNGFVVSCERTREAVLIDPGDEVQGLLTYAEQQSLAIKYILLTHAHIDHVTGVPLARRGLNVPIYLHRDDVFLYDGIAEQERMFGVHCDPLPPVDRFYEAGQALTFGDCEVPPYHTPGHCPGGVCLAIASAREPRPRLFVGDTLFAGSIGRTDFPGGDHEVLLASIRGVLFPFGDDALVYPGHGPMTTIGEERRTNPFL